MYFVMVILLLFVFPLASVAIEALRFGPGAEYMPLVGKWFTFWAVGVRLFVAGGRQVLQPSFTAVEIFDIREPKAFVIVRELGFANLSMGFLGLYSLWRREFILPAAIVGGLYYALAGLGHVFEKSKNAKEQTAMITDFFAFVVLAAFILHGA